MAEEGNMVYSSAAKSTVFYNNPYKIFVHGKGYSYTY